MSQRCYQLVEVRVDSRSADKLYPRLRLAAVCHALVDLLLCLADERVEEVVQRILAHGLELVRMLGVPRLGAVVGVSPPRRPGARYAFGLALRGAALGPCCVSIGGVCGGQRAIGLKGLRYRLLRHDGSIESGSRCSNGLGTQRTGGGRVHEAGVARVLDAVHDGRVAVVCIRARRLALQRAQRAVWAGVAAGGDDGGRLRAWRSGARRRRERASACLARLAGGGRGVLYMVRRISSLQEWEGSSCSTHGACQHSSATQARRPDKARMTRPSLAGEFRVGVRFTVPFRGCTATYHSRADEMTYTCRQPRPAHCLGLRRLLRAAQSGLRCELAPGGGSEVCHESLW
jgi:hypothetical protein